LAIEATACGDTDSGIRAADLVHTETA